MSSQPAQTLESNTAPPPGFAEELAAALRELPGKPILLGLMGAWILLFQFLGNSTFGYVDTPSLFGWLHYSYSQSQDDELGRYIPIIVLFLCWWKRDDLIAAPKAPWVGGLGLLGVAVLLHLLGFMIQQTRLSVVAFYLGLYGLIGACWGPAFLRAIFFPFFLFAFCLPVGTMADTISLPLRMLSTTVTTWISRYLLGVALIQEGTKIFDTDRTFVYEVAAACGGLRSLTATVALASIYAFISFRHAWRRVVMLLSAFPLAVAGNVLRLTVIVLAAEVFGQKAGNWVHDDGFMSLLPYVPAFLGLGKLGTWLREDARPATTKPASEEGGLAAST